MVGGRHLHDRGEGTQAARSRVSRRTLFDGTAPLSAAVLRRGQRTSSARWRRAPPAIRRCAPAGHCWVAHAGWAISRPPASMAITSGGWVDETTPTLARRSRAACSGSRPSAPGAMSRAKAGVALPIFRLPGIYGPGRSPIDQVKAGTARRIDKPGQFFSRIHVTDIAASTLKAMTAPHRGRHLQRGRRPAGRQRRRHRLCLRAAGTAGTAAIPWEDAAPTMTPMARSFYAESRRVQERASSSASSASCCAIRPIATG